MPSLLRLVCVRLRFVVRRPLIPCRRFVKSPWNPFVRGVAKRRPAGSRQRASSLAGLALLAGITLTLQGLPQAIGDEAEPKRQFRERHMGVDVDMTLYGGTEAGATAAAGRAFHRISELERTFSDYDPDSEAMRLCRESPATGAKKVSPDLLRVLIRADDLAHQTGGQFDVTVGPLTKLWRRARRQKEFPDAEAIRKAQSVVGHALVHIDATAGTVALERAGMQLDFGGIVKGYAAEEAVKVLADAGHPRSLVAIAGDIAAGAAPPGQPGWKVGVAPLAAGDPPSQYVCLTQASISTSGDAFQFVELGGVRYSHIVDPCTGVGLTERISVTVISPHGNDADGLATAACLIGQAAGLRLIEATPGCAALIVREVGGQTQRVATSRWMQWVAESE